MPDNHKARVRSVALITKFFAEDEPVEAEAGFVTRDEITTAGVFVYLRMPSGKNIRALVASRELEGFVEVHDIFEGEISCIQCGGAMDGGLCPGARDLNAELADEAEKS